MGSAFNKETPTHSVFRSKFHLLNHECPKVSPKVKEFMIYIWSNISLNFNAKSKYNVNGGNDNGFNTKKS